jgi:hypothetical protein
MQPTDTCYYVGGQTTTTTTERTTMVQPTVKPGRRLPSIERINHYLQVMELENANRRESLSDVAACQQLAAESGLTAGQVEHLLAVRTAQLAERRSTDQIADSLRNLLFGDGE